MLTFTANGKVKLNGKLTGYQVAKDANYYNIYWNGNPLRRGYSSKDKAEVVETLKEIAHKPCQKDKFSSLYYMPV